MPQPGSIAPAFYSDSIESFLLLHPAQVLGKVVESNEHDLEAEQKRAWELEIQILKAELVGLNGWLFFEFDVPRLGSRIDVVLILGAAVFPLEFKCGETKYRRRDLEQAWDYALDLKNFHRGSHDSPIFPVLIATEAENRDEEWGPASDDGVRPPIRCNAASLRRALSLGLEQVEGIAIDGDAWGNSPYHPTPTIIEAARALYARHSVEAISRHDAGATNLKITSMGVEEIIERSRSNAEKAIVFVTGVPGAGKTLVGLNIATQRRSVGEAHAVYLSGNQPLVSVLQEALTRDEHERGQKKERIGAIRQRVKPFIQIVHHFRDEGIRSSSAPHDHIVIFDEAQRAWSRQKTAHFMKQRKNQPNFDQSEPEFLISCLDRHREWAVIICLVGGGQEINTGEAGISEWLESLIRSFPHWKVYISPELTDSEYAAREPIAALKDAANIVELDPRLHLSTSMRSFRTEKVSAFVKAVLDCDVETAQSLYTSINDRYPMAITRDLKVAKAWIREHARGSERFGLLASSEAMRLKPHAIDVRVSVDPIHWFLDDREDTRSSYYLEDAATEFQVQGLELDWACVTWDADLRFHGSSCWRHHSFRGDGWTNIHKDERKRYLVNAYRVLLTRARQGMVLFVPPGDPDDPTRQAEYYDGTFEYLRGVGLPLA